MWRVVGSSRLGFRTNHCHGSRIYANRTLFKTLEIPQNISMEENSIGFRIAIFLLVKDDDSQRCPLMGEFLEV